MNKNNPYYIVAPRFTRTSAGVRVLYALCDLLNKSGQDAYIYLRPHINFYYASSEHYIAPFLTKKIRDYHFENKMTPIVIYPETINIQKFSPPFGVIYFLNYQNLLSEVNKKSRHNYILSYSHNVKKHIKSTLPSSVIFLPVSDYNFFKPKKNIKARKGTVFYAGKYSYHFSGKLFDITKDSIEITRDHPLSQTREEIRELFQRSEFFYCYEDSALALEAILCECPVIFLPNQYFKECLGGRELKGLGYAWGDSPNQVAHAKKTIKMARKRYIDLISEARLSVESFAKDTQSLVKNTSYSKPFAEGYIDKYSLIESFGGYLRFFIEYVEDNGFIKLLKTLFKRLKFKRLKI